MRSRLSPLDLGLAGEPSYPVDYAFFFDRPPDLEALRAALPRVLEAFAPLHATLVPDEEDGLALDTSARAFSFEAFELDRLPPPADVPALMPLCGSVRSEPGEALARARLYRAPSGAALTLSVSHVVADGFSFFLFLTAWARSVRGKDFAPPLHARDLLAAKDLSTEAPTPEDVRTHAGVCWTPGRTRTHDVRERLRLSLSRELLEGLREGSSASDNDVATAWLWKTLLERFPGRADRAVLTFPADFRARLPDFPLPYFGNAVGMRQVALSREEAARASVPELASRIRDTLDGYDRPAAQRAIDCVASLRRHRGLDAMRELHLTDPDCGWVVTNLSRLPLKQLDFGAGPPSAVVPLCPCPRLVSVLPGEDGGLCAHVCVPA